jgi:hypothetical protein
MVLLNLLRGEANFRSLRRHRVKASRGMVLCGLYYRTVKDG